MWRWNAMVVALMLVQFWTLPCSAEDANESLVSQQDWARFEIVLGRVTVFHLRGGQNHRTSDDASSESPRESISVNGDATAPAFRYERFDIVETLSVDVVNRSQVDIQRESTTDTGTVSMRFLQPVRGPIQLTIREGDQQQTYSASSVWHLLLAEPQVCRIHLVPTLSILRPDWRLLTTATEIEVALFGDTGGRPAISRREISTAVARLDSRQFTQRREADRRLRSYGVSVLPYLAQMERSTLSREQRLRLERIHEDLAVPTADSVERVAAWLSNDKAVWLTLLSHHEPSKRVAAVSRLDGIHPGTIQFDPFADEALRRKQIALLRSRIGAF